MGGLIAFSSITIKVGVFYLEMYVFILLVVRRQGLVLVFLVTSPGPCIFIRNLKLSSPRGRVPSTLDAKRYEDKRSFLVYWALVVLRAECREYI